MAAFLGAFAVYLWLTGLQIHHAEAAYCHPAGSLACGINFTGRYGPTAIVVSVFLQAVPALIGAFAGAPVLARELETGTFRYAWTQGIGRRRWTVGKLVLLAVVVTAVAGAFTVLFAWYNQPWAAAGYVTPFSARVFDLLGVAFAAWTLAAFAIGVLAGMLIRRAVPAIAATLAAYAGLAFATALWLREHYITPLVTHSTNLPGSAWIISHWYTKGGKLVSQSAIRPRSYDATTLPPRRGSGRTRSRRSSTQWAISPSTATRSGSATSLAAGSGHSSGSRAAGCSRCRSCSSPRPSGWSAAAPPEPPGNRGSTRQQPSSRQPQQPGPPRR